jgi:hypothetical protein
MSDATHTTTEFDAIIPEVWAAAFYPTLLAKLVFADSVARDYEGEIQALGDKVNVTEWPEFDEADEILENERADADAITASTIQLIVNKQVVKDYIVTKKAARQSIEAGNQLRDLALFSVLKKMQRIIIETIVPSAATPDHAIAYDSGTTLALADILEAKELLDTQDVEEGGRTMIVGAAQQNDLFNITGFTSRDYIPGGSPLTEGAIRTPIMGFNFKWTTEVSSTSYFFQPRFMQIAVQQTPDVRVYDLGVDGKRAQRVNLDVLFGVKQFSAIRVVTVG